MTPPSESVCLGRALKRRSPVLLRSGVHTLITGLTGSGKGSITANWLKATVPFVRDGIVENDAIDLKGGMEFGIVDPALISRHAWCISDALTLLKELDQEVHDRTEWARGKTRRIDPSKEFPRINLFIDEAAELCTAPTRELRKMTDEATGYLDSIMRLSRAVGVVVIAATQDPRQQSMPLRPRFPQRIVQHFRAPYVTDDELRHLSTIVAAKR